MTDEVYAREAAEKSIERKSFIKAKSEIFAYLQEASEAVEKLRGISYVIAKKNNCSTEKMWEWVMRELTSD